ncbi:hypothetical protein KP509_38G013400 [Ceratopteris richardii]|uniref:G domain-containing protein n=1 Tax=Ceratopteris richardii TaxID=49495 RepID=A0A8T2Q2G5_CERRI|nr:hypothetical protein KP509_38G013400 [Ceratopteris richardii]
MGNAPSQRRTDGPHDGGGSSCSRSRSSSSTNTCAQRRGGHLDPCNQLEIVYQKMIGQNDQLKEQFRKAFQSVRILVVGRSGSGKSTLIRLLLGDNGPRSISRGDIAVQDIVTEWRHPDPALPLVIHNSKGVDVSGNERIADIKKFLDARLATGVEFGERVHAVWYVFNVVDNRVLNDGGLLELLGAYGSKELPLLLIMTHNDVAEKLGDGRKKLSETMVRVGNRMKLDSGTGEILKQGSIRDVKGMGMVFEPTKQLMHNELRITWVACQAVDINAKLKASANLVVRFRKRQVLASSALAAVPVAHQLQLAAMFGSVTRGLTKIWNVQQEFEKAIAYQFLVEERKSLAKNIPGALALASALAATVVTSGIAAPSILVAAVGSAWSRAESTSTLLMSYALMVIGSILYVKTHHETTLDDEKATVKDYPKLSEEFMVSEWAKEVSRFSEGYTSLWETSFRQKRQRERLRSEMDPPLSKNYKDKTISSLFPEYIEDNRFLHLV